MRRYERSTVQRFHHVVAVSENDRTLMSAMTDASRITVVPTGVDVATYRSAVGESGSLNVMFLGSMDWPANIDGVEFFCEQVWPRVIAEVPEGCKDHIAQSVRIGAFPKPDLRRETLATPAPT